MAADTAQVAPSIGSLLRQARERLVAVSGSPGLDAELLLCRACGLSRTALVIHRDDILTGIQSAAFDRLLSARENGVPVAYLLGGREFWSLSLTVNEHTLIPRPETELLVETALRLIDTHHLRRVADLGTGAGGIALALARERGDIEVVATDRSTPALAVARGNAQHHDIRNIHFLAADWCGPLAADSFDLIVSNPPYVADGDPHLGEGDVRFEPRSALAAGSDGLSAIRRITEVAPVPLRSGGWLVLEHGHDQGADVRALLQVRGFQAVATHRDLAGLDRATLGRMPGGEM